MALVSSVGLTVPHRGLKGVRSRVVYAHCLLHQEKAKLSDCHQHCTHRAAM